MYRYIEPTQILAPTAVSGTTAYHSTSINMKTITGAAIYASWTGTPNGTIIIEGSMDNVNFTDIVASIPTQPSGSASSTLLNFVDIMYPYLRLTYTNASSTGTLTVTACAKHR